MYTVIINDKKDYLNNKTYTFNDRQTAITFFYENATYGGCAYDENNMTILGTLKDNFNPWA